MLWAMTAFRTLSPRMRPRWWQVGFAVFSVGTAVLLFPDEDAILPVVQGVVGYSVAAVVSIFCAFALHRDGARRFLIGFHLPFIPLQFLFAFATPIPNVGMLLSVMILVGLKPQFRRLSQRARKVWLTLHVGISVGWLGLSLAMTALAITGLLAETHAVRHGAYELMHIFDLTIVIPSVVLSIITGVVVALGTHWGLLKHWWVLVKLVIALGIPAFAAVVENRWVRELAARSQDPAAQPGGLGVALAVCMACFAALLWTTTTLSVVKPWGRTRWGRKDLDTRRTVRAGNPPKSPHLSEVAAGGGSSSGT